MENEDLEAVLATYQQLLANAQRQAITAQVEAARLGRTLESTQTELAEAQERITQLELEAAPAPDVDEGDTPPETAG